MGIVNAHVHFWDPRRIRYPWLNGSPTLNKPMLPADYRLACGSVEVEAIYFMQAECVPAQAMDEVAFVTQLAATDPRIKGIVAYAPLEKGAEAAGHLQQLARNPLVCGVRRMIKSEQDLDFCLRPDFVKGVRLLAQHRFSFALGIKAAHLPNAARLAAQCPDVRFVVDHFAQPDIAHGKLDPWRDDMRRISDRPNVWCKMSSIATETGRSDWTSEQLYPYLAHVLQCWGPKRTMFASDWPVSSATATIPHSVEVVTSLLPNASDRDHVFRQTALDFYARRTS